jgi:hypothetical protein
MIAPAIIELLAKYIKTIIAMIYANELINMQIRCMLQNYNVSSIIPERIIKFHLVVTAELHGNEFLSKFAQILP